MVKSVSRNQQFKKVNSQNWNHEIEKSRVEKPPTPNYEIGKPELLNCENKNYKTGKPEPSIQKIRIAKMEL